MTCIERQASRIPEGRYPEDMPEKKSKKKPVKKTTTPRQVKNRVKNRKRPKNPVGRPTKYTATMPQAILDYGQVIVEEVMDIERNMTKVGDLKWVQKPVEPPLLSGFAIEYGIHRGTIQEWAGVHPEFSSALNTFKEIQEWVVGRMVTHGAYPPGVGIFMLKNLAGWRDKQELELDGPVTLKFDSQDEDA